LGKKFDGLVEESKFGASEEIYITPWGGRPFF